MNKEELLKYKELLNEKYLSLDRELDKLEDTDILTNETMIDYIEEIQDSIDVQLSVIDDILNHDKDRYDELNKLINGYKELIGEK